MFFNAIFSHFCLFNFLIRQLKFLIVYQINTKFFFWSLHSLSTRETLAMGVYFQTFHELKKHINSTLICGGLTGIAAWTLTYPMDVIASRQIAQNIKFKPAFLQKNLWKGINVCLTRAMLVNAVNFKIYETVMNSKHLSFLD